METWALSKNPEVLLLFYVDNQRSIFKKKHAFISENNLVLPCKDGYLQCTEKTLQAFTYVAAHFDFEYVFRTNLGSYLSFDKMLSFLVEKPAEKFYSGIIGYYKDNTTITPFASGSGYFLSHDLINLVVSNQNSVDRSLIDDVAIGQFMQRQDVALNDQALRLSFINDNIEYQVGANTVDHIDDRLIYHVRLRSSDSARDVAKMHALYNSNF